MCRTLVSHRKFAYQDLQHANKTPLNILFIYLVLKYPISICKNFLVFPGFIDTIMFINLIQNSTKFY